ncbi:MAG: hypothetical protein IKL10_00670 [Clostridia bacterium]|nr:hypothetical protein [Clostridia bacterium]
MTKLKNRAIYEFMSMREQLPTIEYLSWWALRLAMVIVFVVFTVKQEYLYERNLVLLNLSLSFVIPLLRFISPKKLFTSKVSFHIQTHVNVFIFMGSFLGHGFDLFHRISEWDKIMHIISGGFVVFIGAELLKAFKGHEKVNAAIKTFIGTGFSFIVMVMWELIEFFADYYISGSNNQGYYKYPDETMVFVKIFGLSENLPDNAAVFDTNVDMFYAVIGCGICALILYIFLAKKEKKDAEARLKESITV